MTLPLEVEKKAKNWANSKAFDQETREEISQLIKNKNEKEILERFHQELSFGTGGMRGIVGSGCARVNKYTLRKATKALCLYLKKNYDSKTQLKVGISFDSRHTSQAFSETVSEVLAYYGIEVYLTKELRPTPLLSFMVRHFSCHAGICITASHNPPNYNGYKVYWADGSQIVTPHDEGIIEEYNLITDYESLNFLKFGEALNKNLIHYCDEELDRVYLENLKKVSYQQGFERTQKIVYTPLHGAGVTVLPQALRQGGFSNVHLVAEQEKPNGSFPTVESPNPEDPKALVLAKKKADEIGADLLLATDPDSDRLAFSFRDQKGDWFDPTGHQQASLLSYYILSALKEKKRFPDKPYLVKTIVTTELLDSLAKAYSCECYDTLTGFKWVADVMAKKEKEGAHYICGGEESFGFLAGSFVRDKDGVGTALVVCEMFSYYQSKGLNFTEVLDQIYREHGIYCEVAENIELPGKEGLDQINGLMNFFRTEEGKKFFTKDLEFFADYEKQEKFSVLENKKETWDHFVPSNVLSFRFSDYFRLVMRPSGTEAKMKFYFFHRSDPKWDLKSNSYVSYKKQTEKKLDEFREEFMIKLKTKL